MSVKQIVILSVLSLVAVSLVTVSSVSAQQRPELYPNDHFKKVGQTQADADTGICDAEARRKVGQSTQSANTGGRMVGGAARGAAIGTLAGAVAGGSSGAKKGLGAGAAVGGVGGMIGGHRAKGQLDPDYKKYVEACLESKGYKVWNWK